MRLRDRLRLNTRHLTEWVAIAAGAGLCLCVIIAAYLSHDSRASEIRNTFIRESQESARMQQLLLRDVLGSVDNVLKSMKRHFEQHQSKADLAQLLSEFDNIKPFVTVLAITNEEGLLVNGLTAPKPGTRIAHRPHFQAHVHADTNQIAVGVPLTGQTTGQQSFHLSRRLNKPDGSFAGVASIGFSIAKFESILNISGLTESRGLALVGTDGIVRVAVGDLSAGQFSPAPNWSTLAAGAADHSPDQATSRVVDKSWIVRTLKPYPLVIAVCINTELMQQRIDESLHWHLLGVSLILLSIILSTTLTVLQIRRQRREFMRILSAEQAIRLSEERFRTVFEKSPLGISLRRLGQRDQPFIQVNQQFCRFLGYSEAEMLTLSLADINDASDETVAAAHEQRLLAKEADSYSRDKPFRRKDGSYVWGQVITTALHFPDGSQSLALTIIQDIHERKSIEQATQESEERYRELFDNHPMPALIREEHSLKIIDANHAACALYGYSRDAFIGMSTAQLQSEATRARYLQSVTSRPHDASDQQRRTHITRAGDEIEVEVHTCPLQLFGRPVRFAVINDITQKVLSDRKLLQSEERLRLVASQISEGLALFDREDRLVFFNEAYKGMQTLPVLTPGVTRFEDLIRARGQEYLSRGEIDDVEHFVQQRVAQHRQSDPIHFERKRGDGSFHMVHETHAPDGQTIVTFVDITELKRREAALAESEEKFRAVFTHAGIGITLRVLDSRLQPWEMVNDYFCEMTGYTREELLTTVTTHDITLPEYNDSGDTRNMRLISGETDNLLREKRILRKDGTTIWVQVSLTVLRKMAGPDRVIATYRNINDRKLAEDSLRISEQQMREAIAAERTLLRTIIDNIPDHIHVKDRALRFMLTNKAWRSARPHTSVGEIGKRVTELMPADKASAFEAEDRAVLASGKANAPRETLIQLPDGPHWFVTVKMPLRDSAGENIGIVSIGRDVTDYKLRTLEYEQLHASLEKMVEERTLQLSNANEELEAFAASVSHDLRTPLRNIDGLAAVFIEDFRDRIDTDGQHLIQRIRDSAKRMADLIEDLLRLSRVSRESLQREAVDLSRMAESIIHDLQTAQPRPEVTVRIAPDLHAIADAGLLRSALDNLLGNAWKFTRHAEHPAIEVGSTRHQGHTIFYVRDNGAGFDKRYAAKLFGAFQRMHTKEEFPGTGIGLATVRRIMRHHGGDAWADAVKGKGAVFFFTLTGRHVAEDLQQDEVLPLLAPASLPRRGNRILVVDDDADALVLAERAFQHAGFSVRTVMNGPAALQALAEAAADIIVSDFSMLGMDGAQLLHQVQTLYPDTLRIILSSQDSNPEMQAGQAAGAIHRCFQKAQPFEPLIAYLRNTPQNPA